MLPTSQGLKASNPESLKRNNWLIFNDQLLKLNCCSQIIVHLHQLNRPHMHALIKHVVTAAAERFGIVHGRVGISQNVFRPLVPSGAGGDPDARLCKDSATLQFKCLGQLSLNSLGDIDGFGIALDIFQQDCEFIAAETRDRVSRA